MTKFLYLFVFASLLSASLAAQPPVPFQVDPSCQPDVTEAAPLLPAVTLIDGVPAEAAVDYVAVLDKDGNVIVSTPIRPFNFLQVDYVGLSTSVIAPKASCAGYVEGENLTVVLYDASATGPCKYFTASNSTFTAHIVEPAPNIFFITGPNNDFNTIDVFDFQSANCYLPLPVDFASFNASIFASGVRLDWTTGKEENNSHFDIETSTTGANWEKIGSVEGAGNSNDAITYEFIDESPVVGQNLYRIKQVDFDGAFTYSSIATARVIKDGQTSAKVFPNPVANGRTTITLEGDWNNATASLHDFSGRKVASFDNLFVGSSTLDLPQLPAGVYQLVIADNENRSVVKVVIR